jgi:DNA-directed RNA polymerase alpha subunit
MITPILCKKGEHAPLDIERLSEDQAASLLCDLRMMLIRRTAVKMLDYSDRARNILTKHNLKTVGDILDISPAKLATLRGLGAKVRSEIRQVTQAWCGLPLKNWDEEVVNKFRWKAINNLEARVRFDWENA